jgi:hypothetical protein
MIAYVKQIATDIARRLDRRDEDEFKDIENWINVAVEELDRLDPRDFSPDARYDFVRLRLRVRTAGKEAESHWLNLLGMLSTVRAGLRDSGALLQEARQKDPRPANLERISKQIEDSEKYERSIVAYLDAASHLFQQVADVLNSYTGGAGKPLDRSFAFIADADLRRIVERDYRELTQVLYPEGAWKSTVVMAGSILEAILYDLLTRDAARVAQAMNHARAPRKRSGAVRDITKDDREEQWTLADLINVAVALNLLQQEHSDTIHQSLREYRNYVHPKKEQRTGFPCTDAEAMQALGALKGVCNHLQ